ncbi:hypothetical protein [Stackebrandtia soli]|uniref:hypothetical protein n=1 Tax=Stackebrandtia soli TaxID=1892856 RepID=UPI0039E792F8
MLWIIPGSPNGLDPAASSAHHADTPGFPGSVHTEPNLGGGLDAEGEPFLIIGAGRHRVGGTPGPEPSTPGGAKRSR